MASSVDVSVGAPVIDSRTPEDVQVTPGTPVFDPPAPDPHLQELMDLARSHVHKKHIDFLEETAPKKSPYERPDDQMLKLTSDILKSWREGVDKVGDTVGEGLVQPSKDARASEMARLHGVDLSKPGVTLPDSPTESTIREGGKLAGTLAADAPLFMLAPELGPSDLAGEAVSKAIMERLGTKAPTVAKILSRAAQGGISAAGGTAEMSAYSAADAALRGKSLPEIGEAATSKGNLLGAAAGVPKLLGVVSHTGASHLANELDAMAFDGHSTEVHPSAPDFKPSMLSLAESPDTGKPVARFTDMRSTGVTRHFDMPIDTPEARKAVENYKAAHNLDMVISATGLNHLNEMPVQDAHGLIRMRGPDEPRLLKEDAIPTGEPVAGHALLKEGDHIKLEPLTRGMRAPVESDTQVMNWRDMNRIRGEDPNVPPMVAGGIDVPDNSPVQVPSSDSNRMVDNMRAARIAMAVPKRGILSKMIDGWVHDIHRGPDELRSIFQDLHGAKALAQPQEQLNAIAKAVPPQAMDDLGKVGEGYMSWDEFRMKHPQVGDDAIKMMGDMVDRIQHVSSELEKQGVVTYGMTARRKGMENTLTPPQGPLSPAAAAARAGDRTSLAPQYLGTFYKAHLLGKNYHPATEATDQYFKFLKRTEPNLDPGDRTGRMLDLLGRSDVAGGAGDSFAGKATDRLKSKDALPPEVRNLLGHESSGAVRIAFTVAHQEQLLKHVEGWNTVARSPWFSHNPDFPGAVRVPRGKEFGAAAGGWIDPSLEPLLQLRKMTDPGAALSRWQWLGGQVKANYTYRNPRAWTNNIMRNVKGSTFADGLRLYEPGQSLKDWVDSLKDLHSWTAAPVPADEGRALVHEARGAGVLPSGFGKVEVTAPNGAFADILKALEPHITDPEGKANFDEVMTKLKEHMLTKHVKAFDQAAKEGYDAIDQIFKLSNYRAIKRRMLAEGKTAEDAIHIAARRIQESFPNFESVGKKIDTLRRTPFGMAVAPFLSGATEDIRNNVTYARLLKRAVVNGEDRKRVASSAVQMGLVAAGLTAGPMIVRHLAGVSEQEADAAKNSRSLNAQRYHYGTIAGPKDSQGRVQLVDMGSWVPELQMMYGDPTDGPMRNLVANLVKTPFQGSLAEVGVQQALESSQLVHPQYRRKALEGETKPYEYAMQQALSMAVPGALTNGYEALRQGGFVGQLSKNEEQLTPTQTAARMVLPGIRPVTVAPDSKALSSLNGEKNVQVKALEKELFQVSGRKEWSPEKKAEVRAAILARIKVLQSNATNAKQQVDQAVMNRSNNP